MIGPKNKTLSKDFLKITIDYLIEESEFYDSLEKRETYFSASTIHKSFLEKTPCINYNDEDFFITEIYITDKPIKSDFSAENYRSTYKYIWDFCDKSSYQECRSDYSDSESDSDSYFTQYSLDILKRKKITYSGSYFSEPMGGSSVGGGQHCDWSMGFIYIQDDISIFLRLGAKRIINEKSWDSMIYEGGRGTPLITEELNKVVYNYKPSDLFFEDDFYVILKRQEFSRNYTFIYNDVTYKVIDYKFCSNVTEDRTCGCCSSYCVNMNENDGFNNLQLESELDRLPFTISCTPEWYIQVQIGSCNGYGSTARFILELIT